MNTIRGQPFWTLLGSLILYLCMTQVSHAAFDVSDIFALDTREPGSNVGYSNIFVLDTREVGSNVAYSNIFTLDTRATVVLYGDVSDNGEVTAFDAALILRHTVKLIALAGRDSVAADVSGVDGISPYDVSLVLQYVVGKIEHFPVEGGGQARLVAFSRKVGIPRVGSTLEGHLTVPVAIEDLKGVLSGEMVVSF